MLKTRIIPCLDVAEGRVVKGVNFFSVLCGAVARVCLSPLCRAKIYRFNDIKAGD